MENQESSFRDRPINIDDTGKRKWIYAKQPKGKWYTRRTIFGWFCILFLVFAPIIQIGGNPLMRFDIANREFYIFGAAFWAQDANILALIMSVVVVFVVLFTVVFGRLWCGWACPQTIFLEMIFRRIEYLFDGNYRKGKRKAPNPVRSLLKHITFYITSLLITNVFLMWFVGPEGLINIISSPPSENWIGFVFMAGISTFYYWIMAHFREQVCTMICPYGRMQGVLLDSRSISVIYDYKRGEPRGAKAAGDCINCHACISVCPTGIDIKNGTQLECINCTACIDECNIVMKRIKKPQDLIRFDSVLGIESGKKTILNTRTYAYSTVLFILLAFLVMSFSRRTSIETTLLRVPGTMYQEIDDQTLSNIYNAKILNKTKNNKDLVFRLITPTGGQIELIGKEGKIPARESFDGILQVKLKRTDLSGKSTELTIGVYEGDRMIESLDINFIGPAKAGD